MEKGWLDKAEIWANIISKIAIPIILLILGSCLNNSYKEKEIRQRYIEIAVSILNNKPSPESLALREWAINTINHYAEIKLSPEAKGVLKERPLKMPHTIDEIKNFDSIKNFDTIDSVNKYSNIL